MKTVKEIMFEKDLAAIYLENKGMTFSSEDSETSHKSSDTSNESKERKRYRYKPKREKTAWNKITNFILNEDPNIFRRILRGMNTQFYEDFEDTALRAYKLDDLKPEDFNALKKIGIRRMNQTSLKTALMNDSGSEDEHIDPFKQVRDKEETVKELVRTRTLLKDKDIVVVEKPQIYTDLINAYRKCKETGYQPKRSFQQKIAEVHKANIDFKAEAAINKKFIQRNSIMMNPPKFHAQKFSAIRKRTQRGKELFAKRHATLHEVNEERKFSLKKVANITRASIKSLLAKKVLFEESQKPKIRYSINKFSDRGGYYKDLGKTNTSWLQGSNLSQKSKDNSKNRLFEKMAEGIPFRNKKNYSISGKPKLSASLRRSLLKKGQLRDRNRSLVAQFNSRGGSMDNRNRRVSIEVECMSP
ncbi:unnamed protein product [Moneuplotes crassus]|uniref:Uncharacterized protein n=1 Tax=Euplotes crassus TaxID=5936 RepID=A0AAD1YB16_EUPCR|nr:unnamed protein product [Moneuplotes crassus]